MNPYINVQIKPELHKRIAAEAVKNNLSMNAMVEQAIETYEIYRTTDK